MALVLEQIGKTLPHAGLVRFRLKMKMCSTDLDGEDVTPKQSEKDVELDPEIRQER